VTLLDYKSPYRQHFMKAGRYINDESIPGVKVSITNADVYGV